MESRFDHLLAFVVLTLIIACKALLDYNKLFDTVPKGESKGWHFTLPTGHGIAIVFINLDGKHGKWAMAGFRNSRRKRPEKFDYKSRLSQLVMKFHYDRLAPEESAELGAWKVRNSEEKVWMSMLADFKEMKTSKKTCKMPDLDERAARFWLTIEAKQMLGESWDESATCEENIARVPDLELRQATARKRVEAGSLTEEQAKRLYNLEDLKTTHI